MTDLTEDQLKRLAALSPLRVIVTYQEGKVMGVTEESFSMGAHSARVNIYWSGKAYSMIGSHELNAADDADHYVKKNPAQRALIFDPMTDDCPIQVDWAAWLSTHENKNARKYDLRNAPFTVKPRGEWQVRALRAEPELERERALSKRMDALFQESHAKLVQINNIINPPEEEEE